MKPVSAQCSWYASTPQGGPV